MTEALQNQLVKENNFVSLCQRQKLRKDQRKLYMLLCYRLKKKAQVTRNDIIYLYKKYVQRIPEKFTNIYNHDKKEWETGYVLLKDYETQDRAMKWFISALGRLIVKGYLIVLPVINIKNFKGVC